MVGMFYGDSKTPSFPYLAHRYRSRLLTVQPFLVRRSMSAIGTKETSPSALHMSAFGGKADITLMNQNST
jgi:hypothetical protein